MGAASAPRCFSISARAFRNTGVPSRWPTSSSVGRQPTSPGTSVTNASRTARAGLSRRRIQRNALGNSMSGRNSAAAASTDGAASTAATTCSTLSRSPGSRRGPARVPSVAA
jgi:hypothetical protein